MLNEERVMWIAAARALMPALIWLPLALLMSGCEARSRFVSVPTMATCVAAPSGDCDPTKASGCTIGKQLWICTMTTEPGKYAWADWGAKP